MKGLAWGVLVSAAAAMAASCGSGAYRIEMAKADLLEFQTELRLYQERQAEGDHEAAEEHQVKALEALGTARRHMEEGRADRSDRPEDLLLYGEILTRTGEHDLAAEVLRRVTRMTPEDPTVWLGLGQALSTLGHAHATEAVEALSRALELEPAPSAQAEAHTLMGAVYAREHLYDLSRESREKALELDPALPMARLGLALLEIRDGRLAEADRLIEGLLRENPGVVEAANDQLAEALLGFEEGRRAAADDPAAHLGYAKLLVRANRYSDAIRPLQRSLKLDARNHVAWNLLGSLRQGLEDPEGAREAFARSLEIEPDQPRTRQALEALEQAARMAPPPLLAAPRGTAPVPAPQPQQAPLPMPVPTPAPAPPTDEPME